MEQFEARWPIGSKPRLALALLLLTGQRRSDVVQLGRQHLRDGVLTFTQAKMTSLTSELGTPYTAESFGNRFRVWAKTAGVAHCTPHGFRKAAAARLAELGASAHELKGVLGHRTPEEVERYTRQAEQAGLARCIRSDGAAV